MKTWIGALSVTSALFLAFACADDDKPTPGETGGAGGEAGNSSETGGTASTGGSKTTGGSSNNGGAGAEGGAGDQGGAGGAPITCEPPEPPSVSSGDAGGAGGAAGAGGVSSVGGSGSELGGGGSGGESATGALAIEGSYVDNFMGHHVVTSSAWTSGSAVYHISAFNNAHHFIIARNDQANEYNPCLWSRFDWTEKAGVLYYCTTAYNAASEAAALATPAADATDPATTGCGGFLVDSDRGMIPVRALALVGCLALLACSEAAPEKAATDPVAGYECDGAGARFATGVSDYSFGTGQAFGQDKFPDSVLGPPSGGGCCAGSLDVTSLGDGGYAVLEFEHNVIIDEDGPDFLVFENPFQGSDSTPETVFAELATISVSQDGKAWLDYPCTAEAYPFGSCAGWHPVFANTKTNDIDPLDPEVAGGDAFDLRDVGLDWARYVRVTDRLEADGGVGTFDLDAAAIVHPGCP